MFYPFGMPIANRTQSLNYRFGFNGKENDNEVNGNGRFQDYGFRSYMSDIARFASVDPIYILYPELTPYQFAGNMPIQYIDLDGLEPATYDPSSGSTKTTARDGTSMPEQPRTDSEKKEEVKSNARYSSYKSEHTKYREETKKYDNFYLSHNVDDYGVRASGRIDYVPVESVLFNGASFLQSSRIGANAGLWLIPEAAPFRIAFGIKIGYEATKLQSVAFKFHGAYAMGVGAINMYRLFSRQEQLQWFIEGQIVKEGAMMFDATRPYAPLLGNITDGITSLFLGPLVYDFKPGGLPFTSKIMWFNVNHGAQSLKVIVNSVIIGESNHHRENIKLSTDKKKN